MAGAVFVSGASGYLAGFTIRQLIADGWAVHGSLRSLSRERELRAILGEDNERLRFFAADLAHDAGWSEAMAGCHYALHIASPIGVTQPKTEDEMIVPARDGSLRVLKAARDAGVKRVVMTSSAAAIQYGHGRGDRLFTEADWTNIDGPHMNAYNKSKTIAERAARDWMASEGGAMEFVSLNPTAIIGPVISADYAPSIEIIKRMLDGSLPRCPDWGFGIVDVRDLAALHIKAMTEPELNGERFIASSRFYKLIEIAGILKANLGDNGRKVPVGILPSWIVRLAALAMPELRSIAGELGRVCAVDSSHVKRKLGWETRPIEETLLDCAHSLIAQGIVRL